MNLAAGGARPPTGTGFQGGSGGGYPAAATTPTYNAPSFPPNQGAPGGGYNYPSQADTDFPTAAAGPSAGTTGYPQAGQSQRPASNYGPPQQGNAGTFNAPSAGGSFAGQPTGTGSFAPAGQRPGAIPTGSQGGFGGPAAAGPQAGFGSTAGTGFGGGSSSSSSSSSQQDENEGDYSAIPGEPEIDYPIFSEIPETSFDCNQQEFPGYYADVEARCQVFHICALNKTFNFLCPNGTIFSQETLVCVWWNQFDCNSAPGLFGNNANLYDNSQTGQQGAGQQGGQQGGFGGQQGPGAQGGVANDFGTGSTGPYPAAGRPQTQTPATSFGSTGPSAPYPAAGAGGYQPSGPSSAGGSYQPPQPSGPAQYPSTPYPSAGAGVPTSYQPPQSDAAAGYPAAGIPQTQSTPNRDYLPPRRG